MSNLTQKQYEHWSLDWDENHVLWLGFNRADSKVNTLNEACLIELERLLDHVYPQKQTKALVIFSQKKSGFIVGADITQFKALTDAEHATQLVRRGQAIFDKLENLTIPTIALIEGLCLGGGLELALACRYRIAENSIQTKLGLPEVKLGIHPGWGGTVRLPKQVGPFHAMSLILSGRTISAKAAKKIGLVQEAVPQRLLTQTALAYAFKAPEKSWNIPWPSIFNFQLVRPLLGRWFYAQLKKRVQPHHYPAPFKVIENWVQYGVFHSQSMAAEARSVGNLLVSDTSRNLVQVFFLQELLKGLAKGQRFSGSFVHVVGAGVMGRDIAAWCALSGLTVSIQDVSPKLIGNAIKCIHQLVEKKLKEKHLVQAVMDRVYADPQGKNIEKAEVIIEAISEKKEAKQSLFALLEKKARPDALLATNTSTIPLEEIGENLNDPRRVVGIHFFNPVSKMPLVEVVGVDYTHPEVLNRAIAFVRSMDKLPLPVKSAPGFLVNRILMPYMLEAMVLLEEGMSAHIIDQAALQFGMPMGPIELADTVGLDICLNALEKLSTLTGGTIPSKLKDYVSRLELGRKTGKGFYEYKKGKLVKPRWTEKEAIPEDIANRLVLRLLNEAVACLREGIVEQVDLLDAGSIFGFGFPPFRGGLMTYARTQGEEKILKLLEAFESRYGERFSADAGWSAVA